MGRYEYTFETNGTSALKAYERPYLRLVGDDEMVGQADEWDGLDEEKATTGAHNIIMNAMALVVAVIVFALAMSISDNAITNRRTSVVTHTTFEQITVNPGDSIWGIAESHGIEGCDTAETVRIIEEKNGLTDAELKPGQHLAVPVREP
ncbi:MAG: LysM peptidoglycan-binding domain-containing protein [Olegusella sp.]|nr:LysM peptidoglycan-binding domain-containing protein [Olegusella sp.]